jgi:hypothetical protein
MFTSILIHELGHVLMLQMTTGNKDWHITVGIGKMLFKGKRITINLFFVWGFFSNERNEDRQVTKIQKILISAGGIIANIFILLLIVAFAAYMENNQMSANEMNLIAEMTRTLFALNLYLAIGSVIPMRYNFWPINKYISNLYSDGYYLFFSQNSNEK